MNFCRIRQILTIEWGRFLSFNMKLSPYYYLLLVVVVVVVFTNIGFYPWKLHHVCRLGLKFIRSNLAKSSNFDSFLQTYIHRRANSYNTWPSQRKGPHIKMAGLICKFWEGREREGKKEAYGVSINFTFFFFFFFSNIPKITISVLLCD